MSCNSWLVQLKRCRSNIIGVAAAAPAHSTLQSTATHVSSNVLISDLIHGVMQDVPPVYDLYAVSNHFGGMGGGHYNAYCKMPDGNWWCFDDSHVHAVDKDKICSSSAYVLFYRRRHEAQQDTGLHCTAPHHTLLHCAAICCYPLRCTALSSSPLHYNPPHCTIQFSAAL